MLLIAMNTMRRDSVNGGGLFRHMQRDTLQYYAARPVSTPLQSGGGRIGLRPVCDSDGLVDGDNEASGKSGGQVRRADAHMRSPKVSRIEVVV